VSFNSTTPPRVQVTGSAEGTVLILSGDWRQDALPELAPDALTPIVSTRLPIDASGLTENSRMRSWSKQDRDAFANLVAELAKPIVRESHSYTENRHRVLKAITGELQS